MIAYVSYGLWPHGGAIINARARRWMVMIVSSVPVAFYLRSAEFAAALSILPASAVSYYKGRLDLRLEELRQVAESS